MTGRPGGRRLSNCGQCNRAASTKKMTMQMFLEGINEQIPSTALLFEAFTPQAWQLRPLFKVQPQPLDVLSMDIRVVWINKV